MRILLDDLIAELDALVKGSKSLRNRVLLQQALDALKQYKKLNENKVV